MTKYFNFNTEEREKIDSEVVQRKWDKDFAKPVKEEHREAKVIQFLANFVVVSVESEFEQEVSKLGLELSVPRQASGNDDATRRDQKDDPERMFNPLKRKRNYGTVVSVPKQLTADIKIYQKKESEPCSNVYRSAEDCMALGIPYIPGGYTPRYVTCADIVPEVQVGDKVYFHYLTVDAGNELKGEDGRTYYKLRYNNIFCVVRDGKIIPIGGFVLLQEVYDNDVEKLPQIKTEKGELIQGITAKRTKTGIIYESNVKPKAIEGIVRHTGTPLRVDEREISAGDIVGFELNANLVMTIEGEEYYVIPYRDILGKA